MSKMNGVDFSSITALSGKSFFESSSGIDTAPVTTDTGVVVCPYNLVPYGPFSKAEGSSYANPLNMLQVSDITGVQQLAQNTNQFSILKTNGDLYVGGWTSNSSMGVDADTANNVINNGGVTLSLTGVSKVSHHTGGMLAIKTNGTLWWTGGISTYLDNTGTGQSTTNANFEWKQIGSDTDWVDIDASWMYPWTIVAIKGSSGSQYLYTTGYNANYGSGLGTNSGITKQFTRVKSAASTNLSESFAHARINYSSCLAVTESGKLFSWGENAQGTLGSGNTTDKPYATQVGSDTDWDNAWPARYGGFAMKTDGTMYMSTGRNSWRIEPNTNRTFTQIGTDTDYEDLILYPGSNSLNYTVFAKKNGTWYISTGSTHDANSWVGSTQKSATTANTWVTVSSFMENAPTGTIDYLLPIINYTSQFEPCVMFALS